MYTAEREAWRVKDGKKDVFLGTGDKEAKRILKEIGLDEPKPLEEVQRAWQEAENADKAGQEQADPQEKAEAESVKGQAQRDAQKAEAERANEAIVVAKEEALDLEALEQELEAEGQEVSALELES